MLDATVVNKVISSMEQKQKNEQSYHVENWIYCEKLSKEARDRYLEKMQLVKGVYWIVRNNDQETGLQLTLALLNPKHWNTNYRNPY